MLKRLSICIFILFLSSAASLQAQFKALYSFTSSGNSPYASLISGGSTSSILYGMTYSGGSSGYGTIFKIQTNGKGFKVLHSFAGGATDGANPRGSLLLKGTTLYGMTYSGGSSDLGIIFKIQTNGTGFKVLRSFAGGATDGARPHGSLMSISSTLYGMTSTGGGSNSGTIFKLQTNGTGFKVLHSFAGGATDGANPHGSLISISSTLYGMTLYGGPSNLGTIFKVQTNGLGYAPLHSFSALATDGRSPLGSLIRIGSTLYGMTQNGGGPSNHGTIFKIQTDGTRFMLLHSFIGAATDGGSPSGSLKSINSTLYGMTTFGGANDFGTIFRINTAGTGFKLLHSFTGAATDGKYPWYGALLLKGSLLYGMTSEGGTYAAGIVFSCGLN